MPEGGRRCQDEFHEKWSFIVAEPKRGRPRRRRLSKAITRDLRRAANAGLKERSVRAADVAQPPTGKWLSSRSDEWVYRALKDDGGELAIETAIELILRLHANGIAVAPRFAIEILDAARPTATVPLVLIPPGEAKMLASYLARSISSSAIRRSSREDVESILRKALRPFERYCEIGDGKDVAYRFTSFLGDDARGRKAFDRICNFFVEQRGDQTVTAGDYTILRRLYVESARKKTFDRSEKLQ
jgi:hypothetical protein